MVREQLLNALPRDLKIWVSERKPKTSTEAADMADNYVRARKQERDPELKRESTRKHGYETMVKRSARQQKKERAAFNGTEREG